MSEIAIINDDSNNDFPVFNGLSFLSKIEEAESLSKKVSILNNALRQEPLVVKNMMEEMKKKGINASKSQDYEYIPVGVIEEALRQIFFRQVDFIIKQSYRDLNSFIVVSRIKYKCPISQEYRRIDGIGAKALQQDSGSKIFDFNATMKANALELGVGIAYSRSVKNAAKKLGKLFGASINRDEEMESVVVFNKSVMEKTEGLEKVVQELFETKKDIIPAEDFDSIKNIVEKKQTKAYQRTIDFLTKL